MGHFNHKEPISSSYFLDGTCWAQGATNSLFREGSTFYGWKGETSFSPSVPQGLPPRCEMNLVSILYQNNANKKQSAFGFHESKVYVFIWKYALRLYVFTLNNRGSRENIPRCLVSHSACLAFIKTRLLPLKSLEISEWDKWETVCLKEL